MSMSNTPTTDTSSHELLTLKQAADKFEVFVGTLKSWVKKGILPAKQTGPKAPYMVAPDQVERLLKENKMTKSIFNSTPGVQGGQAEIEEAVTYSPQTQGAEDANSSAELREGPAVNSPPQHAEPFFADLAAKPCVADCDAGSKASSACSTQSIDIRDDKPAGQHSPVMQKDGKKKRKRRRGKGSQNKPIESPSSGDRFSAALFALDRRSRKAVAELFQELAINLAFVE